MCHKHGMVTNMHSLSSINLFLERYWMYVGKQVNGEVVRMEGRIDCMIYTPEVLVNMCVDEQSEYACILIHVLVTVAY